MLGVMLAIIIAAGAAVSAIWIVPKLSLATSSDSAELAASTGTESQVILELTDPPDVPVGTASLNVTYTQIDLTVLESGSVTPDTIVLVPGGGSATVDLLKLQNVSETLALSSVISGSEIISVTFIVSKISIGINRTTYPVTLAAGGNSLMVTVSSSSPLHGNTNALLIEFNPVIIASSTGYQIVYSSLGIFKPSSEVTDLDRKIGYTVTLTKQDQNELHNYWGNISAKLVGLSVSGNVTSMTIQVNNTGKNPERLILFGIQGDFTTVCPTSWSGAYVRYSQGKNCGSDPSGDVMLIPGEPHNSTGSSPVITPCESRHLSVVNLPDVENDLNNPIIMNPGQCLIFSFSGTLLLGNHPVVPSTKNEQKLEVRVFATNGAEIKLVCTFNNPSSPPKCLVGPNNG